MGVDVARNTVYNRIKASFMGTLFHALPEIEGPANKAAVSDMRGRGRVVE